MKLKTLIRKARMYCDCRHHDMKPFKTVERGLRVRDARWAHSTCKVCGRSCMVNTNPMPNEADMMGEALALECN